MGVKTDLFPESQHCGEDVGEKKGICHSLKADNQCLDGAAAEVSEKFSGENCGFGFVKMPNKEEADKAIAGLNGKDLKSRPLMSASGRSILICGGKRLMSAISNAKKRQSVKDIKSGSPYGEAPLSRRPGMLGVRIRSLLLRLAVAAALALTAGTASAELVAKLSEVLNPFSLMIAGGRIYIVENSVTAHIYTLDPKGASFVKTFGREGQGPGEFDFMYVIRAFKDHLDISGSHKLARFSLDGDYISEVAVTVGGFKGAFYRLGDGYVVRDFNFAENGTTTTIRLYNKDFKLVREIGARTTSQVVTKINMVADYYAPWVVGDQVYVINAAQDSVVTVYDRNGVQQKEIRLPLEPVKMTAALKETIVKPVKESLGRAIRWEDYEKRLFFPGQTPGLDYFEVVEGKFVARTYKYRQDKVEFAVFDEQGRELRRLDLPFTGRLSNGILFCFYQGRYFYLRENPEEEIWELHAEKAW